MLTGKVPRDNFTLYRLVVALSNVVHTKVANERVERHSPTTNCRDMARLYHDQH